MNNASRPPQAPAHSLEAHGSSRFLAWATVWIGVAGLWYSARPYIGVRHDAVLYLLQTLGHLYPGVFSHDIFLQYGSQDGYSAVSRAFVWLIGRFGVPGVEAALPALAHLALLVALDRMLRFGGLARLERAAALAAVAVLPHYYGSMRVFAFGEAFLTARTIAEPLAVVGLLCLLKGQRVAALALLLASAMAHPLVALPVLVVAWLYEARRDRRWFALAPLAVLVVFALALTSRPPFSYLLDRFDPVWFEAIREPNQHVFLSSWGPPDLQILAFDLAVLWLAKPLLQKSLVDLVWAVVVATFLLFAACGIGADLIHDVLLTQLQLWRVQWLTHLLALALVPLVMIDLWRGGASGISAALAVGLAAIGQLWYQGWAFVLWAAVLIWLHRRQVILAPGMRWLVNGATWVCAVGISVYVGFDVLKRGQEFGSIDWFAISSGVPAFGVVLAGALGWLLYVRRRPALALGAALILFAVSAAHWDRRSDWSRLVESGLEQRHPFEAHLFPGAQVYWDEKTLATWLLLKHPSYFSQAQGAGLLFNRETAVEYKRRAAAGFAGMTAQKELCMLISGASTTTACVTPEVASDLCIKNASLDFTVFPLLLPVGKVADWTFVPPHGAGTSITYYLYDCRLIRAAQAG